MSNEENTPDNWDPEPGRRIYVRNMVTGSLGWLVRRDGVDTVRLDRPNQEILVKYENGQWVQELDHSPVSHAQLVAIAFEADRSLLRLLGDHERARKKWAELSEKQRVAWIEDGPKNPPVRQILYRNIIDTLTEHFR